MSLLSQCHKLPIIRIFDNLKLNFQYLGLRIYEIRLYLIFYIYQSSVHFQFSPNIAGFPVILNYFRHDGVFGTGKTQNSRAQRHCDKCFTSYKRISKQKALLEKHQTGVQTGIRVENRGPTVC